MFPVGSTGKYKVEGIFKCLRLKQCHALNGGKYEYLAIRRPFARRCDQLKSRQHIKKSDVIVNPLNVGQIVNNCNKDFTSNVAYHEIDITVDNFNVRLRPFFPNVNYGGNSDDLNVRIIPLIATKDIEQGEELFSTYFTIMNKYT